MTADTRSRVTAPSQGAGATLKMFLALMLQLMGTTLLVMGVAITAIGLGLLRWGMQLKGQVGL